MNQIEGYELVNDRPLKEKDRNLSMKDHSKRRAQSCQLKIIQIEGYVLLNEILYKEKESTGQ